MRARGAHRGHGTKLKHGTKLGRTLCYGRVDGFFVSRRFQPLTRVEERETSRCSVCLSNSKQRFHNQTVLMTSHYFDFDDVTM